MSGRGVLETLRAEDGLAVVLGSGLAGAVCEGRLIEEIPYAEIPGLPPPSVTGHPGRLRVFETGRGRLFVFAGRRHLYEGGDARRAGATARLARRLGCSRLLLTHAAGSLRRSLSVGCWLLALDLVSFPWRGLTAAAAAPSIDGALCAATARAAAAANVPLRRGVLFWTAGPAYETPAEAAAAALAGCDAATMSPLPELLEARRAGIRAACLAWITNYAPNVLRAGIGHDQVVKAGARGRHELGRIVAALARSGK